MPILTPLDCRCQGAIPGFSLLERKIELATEEEDTIGIIEGA